MVSRMNQTAKAMVTSAAIASAMRLPTGDSAWVNRVTET